MDSKIGIRHWPLPAVVILAAGGCHLHVHFGEKHLYDPPPSPLGKGGGEGETREPPGIVVTLPEEMKP